jgi:hypothetical protein
MPVRNRCTAALTARGSAAEAGHFGGGAGLIDEHQALGVQLWLKLEPSRPMLRDVRPILLAGVRGFF